MTQTIQAQDLQAGDVIMLDDSELAVVNVRRPYGRAVCVTTDSGSIWFPPHKALQIAVRAP